ncbi:Origin recognition complex subunit 3, partial [Nowakowskiella sp. JEL0078]
MLDLNTQTFDKVTRFIELSHQSPDRSFGFNENPNLRELPVGVILTGTNLVDNDSIFRNLGEHIRRTGNHKLALLYSSECGNLKSTLICLINQLKKSEDEEEEKETDVLPGGAKIASFDLRMLVAWYSHLQNKAPKSKPI